MHCQYAAHRSRTRTVPPVKTLIALCLALTLPWIASASVLPRAARPATPPIHAKAAPSPAMQAVTHFIYLHPTDRPVWQDYINAVQHSALTLERWYRAQLGGEYALRLDQPIVRTVALDQDAAFYRVNRHHNLSLAFWDNVLAEVSSKTGAQFDDPANV